MRLILCLLITLLVAGPAVADQDSLGAAIDGEHRSAPDKQRDGHRHPRETLEFFGIRPDMTVVEIWPSRGWYMEILAPYLKGAGTYYAAGFSLEAKRTPDWRKQMQRELNSMIEANPDLYGEVIVTGLSVPQDTDIAPPGTADMVLTFRNVHNWMKGDYAPEMFEVFHEALKPGGILGVVEHRAPEDASIDWMKQTGYVGESYVIDLATKAGFELVHRAEINANPKDTKNHPFGVWTLPPALRMGERDIWTWLEIGESDRMTLKFVKPENGGKPEAAGD